MEDTIAFRGVKELRWRIIGATQSLGRIVPAWRGGMGGIKILRSSDGSWVARGNNFSAGDVAAPAWPQRIPRVGKSWSDAAFFNWRQTKSVWFSRLGCGADQRHHFSAPGQRESREGRCRRISQLRSRTRSHPEVGAEMINPELGDGRAPGACRRRSTDNAQRDPQSFPLADDWHLCECGLAIDPRFSRRHRGDILREHPHSGRHIMPVALAGEWFSM